MILPSIENKIEYNYIAKAIGWKSCWKQINKNFVPVI